MHDKDRGRQPSVLRQFFDSEASAGLTLMFAATLALLVANSPASQSYFGFLQVKMLGLSVLHWVNDGLMAVFFLLVGLEIKREILDGQLASWSRRALPGIAALGGMIVPAAVFIAINQGDATSLRGWAIPAATDIAFALGVLSLAGPRVPVTLKIFLTALAILDDLGAVAIIAAFYTDEISLPMLGLALAVIAMLAAIAMLGVRHLVPYLVLGAGLWFLVLKSGVHPTLAGVALAFCIPLRVSRRDSPESPLLRLEHALSKWVAFLIVPVFGFANAGLSLDGVGLASLLQPVTLGVAAGLFVGKQAGVFGFAWLAVRLGLARMPGQASWAQLYGVATLCGIGFTMSLFIGLLAYENAPLLEAQTKLGVLSGSLLAGIIGWAILRFSRRRLGPTIGSRS